MSDRDIKLFVETNVHLSAHELATVWCAMCAEEQAEFFNKIAELTSQWEHPFCMQLSWISANKYLTDDGRRVMAQIGEYSVKEPATRPTESNTLTDGEG